MTKWALLSILVSAVLWQPAPAQEPAAVEAPSAVVIDVPASDSRSSAHSRIWGVVDYEIGWLNGMRLPPLLTTSPAGTPKNKAGVLGEPTTTILFGKETVDDEHRDGVTFGLGYWFDCEPEFGVDLGYTSLESQSKSFNISSNGEPILARPVFGPVSLVSRSILVAFPGLSNGTFAAQAQSGNFQDFHVDFREVFYETGRYPALAVIAAEDSPPPAMRMRFESLLGYRYIRLSEQLNLQQAIFPTSSPFIPGTEILSEDRFGTKNEFHAGEAGVRGLFYWDRFSVELLGKLAVGQVQRRVQTEGQTITTVPGAAPLVATGGLLALSSNIGEHSNSLWLAAPETGVTLGYDLTRNARISFGYHFLYMTKVARPGDQIDLGVNPTLLPNAGPASGPDAPAPASTIPS